MFNHFEALIESYLISEKRMRPKHAGDSIVIRATPEIKSGEQIWNVSTGGDMGIEKIVIVSISDLLLFMANGSFSEMYSLRDSLEPTGFSVPKPRGESYIQMEIDEAIADLYPYKDEISKLKCYSDLLKLDEEILMRLIAFERLNVRDAESSEYYAPNHSGGHYRDMLNIYEHAIGREPIPEINCYVCMNDDGSFEVDISSIFSNSSEVEEDNERIENYDSSSNFLSQ